MNWSVNYGLCIAVAFVNIVILYSDISTTNNSLVVYCRSILGSLVNHLWVIKKMRIWKPFFQYDVEKLGRSIFCHEKSTNFFKRPRTEGRNQNYIAMQKLSRGDWVFYDWEEVRIFLKHCPGNTESRIIFST